MAILRMLTKIFFERKKQFFARRFSIGEMSLTVRTWGDLFSPVSSTSDACVDNVRVELLVQNLMNLEVFLTSNVESFTMQVRGWERKRWGDG